MFQLLVPNLTKLDIEYTNNRVIVENMNYIMKM